MNCAYIIISVLLSVICVLLALLQHFYYMHRLHIESYLTSKESAFSDLIPISDFTGSVLPQMSWEENDDSNDDVELNSLNTFLSSIPQSPNTPNSKKPFVGNDLIGTDSEAYNTFQAAIAFHLTGKSNKAMKLFEHAVALAPKNADVLNKYGEFVEETENDVLTADELYFKALTIRPDHEAALSNRKRTSDLVEAHDFNLFKTIDIRKEYLKAKLESGNYDILKKQAYYLHIYHTVGIEGNTMTVKQLKYVLETGLAVTGKSVQEHNEIIGLEKAMQYIKYLTKYDYIGIREILSVHNKVMARVDPEVAGKYRDEKVFVGSHRPPNPEMIPSLMDSYVHWLNSDEAQRMHPIRYAALAHYKLVDIHPFVDGNGRTSRLIMNLILMKYGYPPIMVLKEQREEYYDALKTANLGDVRRFVRFIAQSALQVIEMYLFGTRVPSIEAKPDTPRINR